VIVEFVGLQDLVAALAAKDAAGDASAVH